jgi:hypothetical protein
MFYFGFSSSDNSLVPIDHGCCLPSKLGVSEFEWCWMNWPQLKQPIHHEVRAYIESLDADRDIAMLQNTGLPLPSQALNILRLMTHFIKTAVAQGWTLYDIASCIAREDMDSPSTFERMIRLCKWRAAASVAAHLNQRKYSDEILVQLEQSTRSHAVLHIAPKAVVGVKDENN